MLPADPEAVGRALSSGSHDLVTVVHAETSTGVRNPIDDVARVAHEHGALVIADAVTSIGAIPVDMTAWDIDVCDSCSQKGLGAPSGLSPIAFGPRALERRIACRNFSLDLGLLEDYWVRRKYHHTISAPLVYALNTALTEVEEEGLPRRGAAVGVPGGVDEAAVRAHLLKHDNIEIGAGLGPLAGRIWRVGLMGSGATAENVDRLMQALPAAVAAGRRP